jgi:hypothetical protein
MRYLEFSVAWYGDWFLVWALKYMEYGVHGLNRLLFELYTQIYIYCI